MLKVLRTKGAKAFIDSHLFDAHSWYFPSRNKSEYEDFKDAISKVFGASPGDVAIVGSAKYGFSLAPDNEFRPFDISNSDIDVVVVSPQLFNSTWNHLRQSYYGGDLGVKGAYEGGIFCRYVMVGTDTLLEGRRLRNMALILDKARKVATSSLAIEQVLKVRIYGSWTDAKAYHIWSADQLREKHDL